MLAVVRFFRGCCRLELYNQTRESAKPQELPTVGKQNYRCKLLLANDEEKLQPGESRSSACELVECKQPARGTTIHLLRRQQWRPLEVIKFGPSELICHSTHTHTQNASSLPLCLEILKW